MAEYLLASFASGNITHGTPLPIQKGSDNVYLDVNAEGSIDIKVPKNALPGSSKNEWRELFKPMETILVLAEGDTILSAGFITKANLDHKTQLIEVRAEALLEYLSRRLVYEDSTRTITDSGMGQTFSASTWEGVIKRTVQKAFTNPAGTPSNIRVPNILGSIGGSSNGSKEKHVLYADQEYYKDVLESIRDEHSAGGNEFRFVPRWSNVNRNRVVFDLVVGTEASPKINQQRQKTIRLEENTWKISSYSSSQDYAESFSRVILKSKDSDRTSEDESDWTDADMQSTFTSEGGILSDEAVSFPVELTSSEMNAQKDAYQRYAQDAGIEVSMTSHVDDPVSVLSWLGEIWTLEGIDNTLSGGDSARVRVVGISFSVSKNSVEVDLQSLKPRYPRLPKRRMVNDYKNDKRDSKLKNQKWEKGKTPGALNEKAAGYIYDGSGGDGGGGEVPQPPIGGEGFGHDLGVNAGFDGTGAVDPGTNQWEGAFLNRTTLEGFYNPDETRFGIGDGNLLWGMSNPGLGKSFLPSDNVKYPAPSEFPELFDSFSNILRVGSGRLWNGALSDYRLAYQHILSEIEYSAILLNAWQLVVPPDPQGSPDGRLLPGVANTWEFDFVEDPYGNDVFKEVTREWLVREAWIGVAAISVVNGYMYATLTFNVLFDYERTLANRVEKDEEWDMSWRWQDGYGRGGKDIPQPQHTALKFTVVSKIAENGRELEGFGLEDLENDPLAFSPIDFSIMQTWEGQWVVNNRRILDEIKSYKIGDWEVSYQETQRSSNGLSSTLRKDGLMDTEWTWNAVTENQIYWNRGLSIYRTGEGDEEERHVIFPSGNNTGFDMIKLQENHPYPSEGAIQKQAFANVQNLFIFNHKGAPFYGVIVPDSQQSGQQRMEFGVFYESDFTGGLTRMPVVFFENENRDAHLYAPEYAFSVGNVMYFIQSTVGGARLVSFYLKELEPVSPEE